MVVGQYISQEKLCEATPKQRDQLVMNVFGFTYEELNDLRRPRDTPEHLENVAKAIYEKTDDPLSITGENIAAVGSLEWKGKKTTGNYAFKISKTYKQEKDDITAEKRIKITNMHVLRKRIGAYSGNLEETAPLWEVQPSKEDWLRSIKLPESLDLDYDTSQLIGVIWADGHPIRPQKNSNIHLSGTINDITFYEKILKPQIKKIFNYDVNLILKENEESINIIRGEKINFNRSISPFISLGSKVITEFFFSIGFPKKKKNIELPNSDKKGFSYDKKAFFEGIVACMSSKSKVTKGVLESFQIGCEDKDTIFIENLHELTTELGYRPSNISPLNKYGVKSTRFCLSPRNSKKIKLINPKHSS